MIFTCSKLQRKVLMFGEFENNMNILSTHFANFTFILDNPTF